MLTNALLLLVAVLAVVADFHDIAVELQAKLLNYFLGSNKSNINQKIEMNNCDAFLTT